MDGGMKDRSAKRKPRANAIDRVVAQNLRSLRVRAGLSQADLGAAVGITPQQVQKYEKASNRMSAARLHHFAHILGCGVEDFFEGCPPEDKIPNKGLGASPDEPKFVAALRRVQDPATRKTLLRYIKKLGKAA
ncbi:MAG: helix-turn-helix transcriptional regulator [Alphaproteobacteria bacterium]|nr:helix-turn-helix transcriptional regulator [Alphaproteobacteria bacterium]MBP7761852.1 helix-turn-helix transcriptional regulator [Alphaproteobacteria bacterium]